MTEARGKRVDRQRVIRGRGRPMLRLIFKLIPSVTNEDRKFLHGMIAGSFILTGLTGHLYKKPDPYTHKQLISAIALQIDGKGELYEANRPNLIADGNKPRKIPIPTEKPQDGYTDEFRANIDDLVKLGYLEKF